MSDNSKFLYYRDLTRAYHMLGDHTRELAGAAAYGIREPGRLPTLYLRARALVGLGRTDAVLALIDSGRSLPDEPILWDAGIARPDILAATIAAELDFHSFREAAQTAARLALSLHAQRSDSPMMAGLTNAGDASRLGWAALYVGEHGEARRLLTAFRSSATDDA
jgi:hypothetical protein